MYLLLWSIGLYQSGYKTKKHSLGVVCVCACMYARLLFCLSVCVPACIHVNTDLDVYIHLYIGYACMSAYLFAYLPVCMRAWLSAYLAICMHFNTCLTFYIQCLYIGCISICMPVCLSAYLPASAQNLFVCLPVCLSASLYASPSPTPSPQNHTIKIQITPFCFIKHKITFICYHNMLSGVPPQHPPSNASITDSATQQHMSHPWVQQGCNITLLKDVTPLFSRM